MNDKRMKIATLPCPFCGSDKTCVVRCEVGNAYQPGCRHCGASLVRYSTARTAAKKWNTRIISTDYIKKLNNSTFEVREK